MQPPLNELKILDFTSLLPGPFGSMMLADLGADIIKVENPGSPDPVRFMPPIVNGVSALYAHLNRGKRSLCLDLKKKKGRDVIRALVTEYDILLEQFRPGVMARLGLGYDDLRKINPRIIYCSLSGYGQDGPLADRAGHDINYRALAGIDSFSGRKETGPCPGAVQLADICGGSKNLVIAVLAAYINRLRTGTGDHIDLSMTDGVFALSVFSAAGYLAGGREPGREQELLNGGVLYDYYQTADGRYLSVGPLEPKFFAAFCETIGHSDLAAKGIMANVADPSIKNKIAATIKSKSLSHWRDVFSRTDACVEPVLSVSEACGSALLRQRGMIVSLTGNGGVSINQIGNPIKFGSYNGVASFPGVAAGTHNESIFYSLGYSDTEINSMKETRVF